MKELTAQNVRAFLERDWERSAQSKGAALGRLARARGAGVALALGDALRAQVWPRINAEAEREKDLAAHLALGQKLRRAGATFRR